jgi:hypothetical protein
VDACLQMGRPGDLVVLLATTVDEVWRQVNEFVPARLGVMAVA